MIKALGPSAKDIRKFEKTIETVHPSGQVDRVHDNVEPDSPPNIAGCCYFNPHPVFFGEETGARCGRARLV